MWKYFVGVNVIFGCLGYFAFKLMFLITPCGIIERHSNDPSFETFLGGASCFMLAVNLITWGLASLSEMYDRELREKK